MNDCSCFLVFNYSHHQTQLTHGLSNTIPSCGQEIKDLNMSAHVLLNLLNELEKKIRCEALPSI